MFEADIFWTDLDRIDSMSTKVIPFQVILAERSKLFTDQ